MIGYNGYYVFRWSTFCSIYCVFPSNQPKNLHKWHDTSLNLIPHIMTVNCSKPKLILNWLSCKISKFKFKISIIFFVQCTNHTIQKCIYTMDEHLKNMTYDIQQALNVGNTALIWKETWKSVSYGEIYKYCVSIKLPYIYPQILNNWQSAVCQWLSVRLR